MELVAGDHPPAAAAKRQKLPQHQPDGGRPIPFSIDLNEAPSPSSDTPPSSTPTVAAPSPSFLSSGPADALFVARWFHSSSSNGTPAIGGPADPPGEAGVGQLYACAACGKAETRGGTLVCDGCERGFHFQCARTRVRQVLAGNADWVCGDCVLSGVRSKRWQLGVVHAGPRRGGVRLLDMNALPPSDVDVDSGLAEEFHCSDNGDRMGTYRDYASGLNGPGLVYMGNGVGTGKGLGAMKLNFKRLSESLPQQGPSITRGFEDPLSNSSLRENQWGDNGAPRAPSQLEQEIFLQALKEFISERHGSLDSGWHVEFKHSANRCESTAVYCAPNGKRFESMFDVANYLQLTTSNVSCGNDTDEKSETPGSVQRTLTRRRRRKELARLARSNSYVENQEIVNNNIGGEVSETETTTNKEFSTSVNAKLMESTMDEDVSLVLAQLNVRLPIQYEDFYINSLGKIDCRPAYHNASHIWPVGYQSSWHDRITGSLFKCEVLDGGDSGPIFRVRRYPCSSLSALPGETILLSANSNKVQSPKKEGSNDVRDVDRADDEDDEIQVLLSDPCPEGQEFLLHCPNRFNEVSGASFLNVDVQRPGSLKSQLGWGLERSKEDLNQNQVSSNEIEEFSVEGRSSSLVWRMVSQSLVDACYKVYKQSHSLQFHCKHRFIPRSVDHLASLAKFSYAAGPIDAHAIDTENDVEPACKSIAKWLDFDRFGLDMDFVQEIVEKLPGAHKCSQYEFLCDRSYYSTSQTVGSGLLLAKCRNEHDKEELATYDLHRGSKKLQMPDQSAEPSYNGNHPPPGRPLISRLPSELVGDVLQICELFGRFYKILGLKEPLSFEELEEELINPWCYESNSLEESDKEILESRDIIPQGPESARGDSCLSAVLSDPAAPLEKTFIQVETESMKEAAQAKEALRTYERCTGVALTKAHISLLKVLVAELQCKVAAFADPNFDAGELKPRRGRRKEADSLISVKKPKIDMLPLNELTWPEVVRRYVLAVSAMDCILDSTEISSREGMKVYRCLQGDGGILCGSLAGVAGMEADALLLAEAGRQISVGAKHELEVFPVECKDPEPENATEPIADNNSVLPEWAQLLKPVRKLPTNVGTRIRKCVYDSLEKDPPEWARKILEHSISKEVYKGNASGPTKKAVLSVLAQVSGEIVQQKPKARKGKHKESLSNLIMKQCRIVLRRSIVADEGKVFCNLLGTALLNLNDNDDEGILGSPGMTSRPLDFRTIDLRLAVGSYGGSHEAFHEDVCEVWRNIRTAYGDRSDLMELADTLSQNFESLFEEKVLSLVQTFSGNMDSESLNPEVLKKLDSLLRCSNELPMAPWEDGVCKVCGIDKDDDSVLLCDSCDSEYHTYCLNPPLSRIPAGNWYCPSCIASQSKTLHSSYRTEAVKHSERRSLGEKIRKLKESLNWLAASLEEKEYWDLNLEQRVFLLKFLSDEVLNSVVIREHLDQCVDVLNDLQQKMRSLATDLRNVKLKEAMLSTAMFNTGKNGFNETVREEGLSSIFGSTGRTMQLQNFSSMSNHYSSNIDNTQRSSTILENTHEENGSSEAEKKLGLLILKSKQDKQANGNRSELLNLCELQISQVPDQEMQIKVDNLPIHRSLSTVTSSNKDDSSRSSDQSFPISKKQKTEEVTREEVCISEPDDGQRKPASVRHSSDCSSNRNEEMNDSPVPHGNLDGLNHLPDTEKACLDMNAVVVSLKDSGPTDTDNSLLLQKCGSSVDVTDSQSCTAELASLKNETLQLQNSVINVESQILMASNRRDFLGRDSSGRIYWSMVRPGKCTCLLVDGSVRVLPEGGNGHSSTIKSAGTNPGVSDAICCSEYDNNDDRLSPWMIYESDADIQELASWLKGSDPRERELKESILQWQKVRSLQAWNCVPDSSQRTQKPGTDDQVVPQPCLLTKAFALLEKRYGPCLETEVNDIPRKRSKKNKGNHEIRMYRCECLEPVWPSRHHCLSCHQTFNTGVELEEHSDGKCMQHVLGSDEAKENDASVRGRGTKAEGLRQKEPGDVTAAQEVSKYGISEFDTRLVKVQNKACPFDFEEISKKFITKNSNKDLIQEIGLIGSNGIPTLIESTPSDFFDSSVMLNQAHKTDVGLTIGWTTHEGKRTTPKETGLASSDNIAGGVGTFSKVPLSGINNVAEESQKKQASSLGCANEIKVSHMNKKLSDPDGSHKCSIPESSMRPLYGKVSQILKRLKVNLLDMDAALPEEAMRSLITTAKRCAWRAFVKSAESIYEMVQATILFEGMIRTEFLKNEWWYWSSLTAAAKSPTLSSLALRIYSLDASIIYSKCSQSTLEPADNPKASNKNGKKRKDIDGGS